MKSETQTHNVVLEDFYNYAVEKGLKINHLFTFSQSVNLVKSYIENTPSTRIRKINTKFVIDNLEFILSNNRYLFSMKTRTDNDFIGGENFDYLNSFLKEFSALDFNMLNKENIDAKIKWILNVILQKYPELEQQEIQNLLIVASVTYNSFNYWTDNFQEWCENLGERKINEGTRGGVLSDLWKAVKSGTLKCVKADADEAVGAIVGGSVIGVVTAPIDAAAGAAAGSLIGGAVHLYKSVTGKE